MIETTGIKGGNGRKDVGYHWCVTCNCSAGKKKVLYFFFFFFFRAASGSRCGRLGDSQTSRSISRTRSVIDGATSVQLWPGSSGHWRRRVRRARQKFSNFGNFGCFSKLNFKFNKNLSHSTCQKIKILPKKTGRLLETLNKLARRALC